MPDNTLPPAGSILNYLKPVPTQQYLQETNQRLEEEREEREVARVERRFQAALKARRDQEALRVRKREDKRRSRARQRKADLLGTEKRPMELTGSESPSDDEPVEIQPLLSAGPKADLSRPFRKASSQPAKNMNWFAPFIWDDIEQARKDVGWHPAKIEALLKRRKPAVFASQPAIHHGTIRRWMKPGGGWTEAVQRRIKSHYRQIYNATGQTGVLTGCIDTVEKIKTQLIQLREALIALSAHLCQGIILGHLSEDHSEVFTRIVRRTGQPFTVSLKFVRRFLHAQLGWSIRHATKAGQLVPEDYQEQCYRLCLRTAWLIKHYRIPADCIVNSDQMQVQLQHGGSITYAARGSKQVEVLGKDEKRAFTAVTGLSAAGQLLPFQSVWEGTTNCSLPFGNKPNKSQELRDALNAGHLFALAPNTYWSTQPTMEQYVRDLLVPHFHRQNERHGRSSDARCIWIIDVWSIHRSEAFRGWMQATYPWILLQFIPGNCTGIMQPADAGMQRPLKNVIRKAALDDVVNETRQLLRAGTPPEELQCDVTLPTLRKRSVTWLMKAHAECNRPEIVLKAWELCRCGKDNMTLAYDCLTSPATQRLLDDLPFQDGQLFRQILPRGGIHDLGLQGVRLGEDEETEHGIDTLDIILDEEAVGTTADDHDADLIMLD